eukprot:7313062-Pyramimonas_sp.AAC.1
MRTVGQILPALFLLECTKGLNAKPSDGSKSNLETIVGLANEEGYHCVCIAMESLDFGLPSRRERYYVVGLRVSDVPFDQYDEGYVDPAWEGEFMAVLESLKGVEG